MAVTPHQLELLDAVARALNMTRVARERRVDQSAISHQIEKLEQEFGQKFIHRNGQGVGLTEVGVEFWQAAQPILTAIEELYRKFAKNRRNKSSQVLKVGGSHGPSSRLIPSLVTRFREIHSGIESVQKSGTSKEIETLLRKNVIDITIVSHPSTSGEFSVEPFLVERVLLVVAKNHLYAKKCTISRSDLVELPLLVFEDQGGSDMTTKFLQHKMAAPIRFKVAMRFDTTGALISAAKSGAGVGVVYEDMVAEELRSDELKVLKPVGFDLSGRSHLVSRKGQAMPPIAWEFLKFARTERDSNGKVNDQLNSRAGINPRSRQKRMLAIFGKPG